MAKNDVRTRTVSFLAIQSAILGVIMLAFVVLASVLFVKNATRWQLRNIEENVLMFARQAAHSGEIPKRGDLGPYTFFILTQDGKYVLPRLSQSDEGERLWQEYERKLVYEMQKRRDGWIYYPEGSPLGLRDGQYVIRYVYLEQQGWVVAVEGYVSSGWSMLKGFLTPKLFMGLSLIVLLAFTLMLFNAFWHFRKMMKAVLRLQENNFIAAPAKIAPESVFVKREDASFSSGVIQGGTDRTLPKAQRKIVDAPHPVKEEAQHVPPPVFNPRKLDNLGEELIDTVDIRSPLLKKAIEEMREKK